jgi:hypothetical protein
VPDAKGSAMCFSAAASFGAAAATAVGGVVALVSARTTSHLLLAAIPLSFAIHQLAEGVVWLALSHDQYTAWLRPAMFLYLVLTRAVWPVLVPVALLALERDDRRRTWLRFLAATGIVLSVAVAYGLIAYPVSANIDGGHVQYRLDSPLPFRWVIDLVYAVVTVGPPLVSSNRRIRVLGLIVVASLVISKIFFYWYFISVWCFFAAWCSILIVLVVRNDRWHNPGERPRATA